MNWSQRRVYEISNKRHGAWGISEFNSDLKESLSFRMIRFIKSKGYGDIKRSC